MLNPQTRTIDVFLRVPNPLRGGVPAALASGGQDEGALASRAPPLLVGSFVEAEIEGPELGAYAAIPLAALRSDNQIWLVEKGKVRVVQADIIQRKDTEVIVRSENLGAKPQVIIGGLANAINGQQVRTTKDGKKPKPAAGKKAQQKAASE